MPVRFVVGRAGSGKTWRCLEAIRARLRESPVDGPRLLLIVPEQASFQMERALIETPDLAGFVRCEVLSFQRLAYRIFAETGVDPRRGDQTIGSLGRIMVLRRLMRRERSRLTLLGRVADKPGLVRQVATALDELMRQEVSPEKLAELASRDRPEQPLESAKLADLTRLYQSYLDYLLTDPATPRLAPEGEGATEGSRPGEASGIMTRNLEQSGRSRAAEESRIDPAQYLALAAERLPQCGAFNSAEVWVDGFAGFTTHEYHLLAELARRAGSVEITMLVDPHASAIEANALPPVTQSLFARTERTAVRVRRELTVRGVGLDTPVRLERTHFVSAALGQLERAFFCEETISGEGLSAHAVSKQSADRTDEPLARAPGSIDAGVGNAVSVCELADRRSEVVAAIDEIRRLTRDEGLRYRDIAIIVRDLEPYHDLVGSLMRSHGIPCFIDRRQPTTHHPLVELLRSLLAVACDDCRFESVRLMLKTGLLPMPAEDADLLENYLLATGIQGRSTWQKPWQYTRAFHVEAGGKLSKYQEEELAKVNQIRQVWLDAVGGWLDAAETVSDTGLSWAGQLYACLKKMDVPRQIGSWADAAEADGRASEADAHRQVWNDFVELMDEFSAALGDEEMKLDEFREALEAGLAEFSLGLAPPTLDEVLVGAIERSRHPNVKAAIVLGFDESLFPRRRSEDPLLGDAEREALEEVGIEVGPSRRRQLLDERMLVYIALTRASQRLYISYPRADADGKALQPSPYLRDVLEALSDLKVQKVADPTTLREPKLITSVPELGARLASEFRYRSALDTEANPARRAEWNALYAMAGARDAWQSTLRRSLSGLAYHNEAELSPAIVKRMLPERFETSVSRLERFAACPFAHFIEYTLKLEPRSEADMADVDLGKMCHTVLEKFVQWLVTENKSLAEMENDKIDEVVDRIAADVVPQRASEMIVGEARNAYLLDRSRGHLSRVAKWQRDAARGGKFRSRWVEQPFGYDEKNRLVLKTPSGRMVYLRGRIDRVDVAELGEELLGLVIDYKRTTDRRLDLGQLYHGLTLQLVGYLLALQQAGHSLAGRDILPVAALYLPLLEPFETVSHPEKEKKSSYRMRGVIDSDALGHIDAGVVSGGASSRYVSARLTKDGKPYASSDLAGRDQMQSIIGFAGARMGQLADEILDGHIEVLPYRLNRKTPCSFCEYQAVCRYEVLLQKSRSLEAMKRGDALVRICNEAPEAAAKPSSERGENP